MKEPLMLAAFGNSLNHVSPPPEVECDVARYAKFALLALSRFRWTAQLSHLRFERPLDV